MNIKSKLTSRKFWMALAAFVVGLLTLFQVDANTTQQISGVIMSLGAVIAYIVGEGLVDAAATNSSQPNITARGLVPLIGGVVYSAPAEPVKTAQVDAASVKQDTAISTAQTDMQKTI